MKFKTSTMVLWTAWFLLLVGYFLRFDLEFASEKSSYVIPGKKDPFYRFRLELSIKPLKDMKPYVLIESNSAGGGGYDNDRIFEWPLISSAKDDGR